MDELQKILEQLRDVHAPPPVGMWPLAPGWWFVLALLCIASVYALWRLAPWLRSLVYRYNATRALDALMAREPDEQQMLSSVNLILRRTAQYAYPRHHASALAAREWLKFLDRSAHMNGFSRGAGLALAQEAYKMHPRADREKLYRLARHWIRHHRVKLDPDMHRS